MRSTPARVLSAYRCEPASDYADRAARAERPHRAMALNLAVEQRLLDIHSLRPAVTASGRPGSALIPESITAFCTVHWFTRASVAARC